MAVARNALAPPEVTLRVMHEAVPKLFFEGPQVFFGDVVHETPF